MDPVAAKMNSYRDLLAPDMLTADGQVDLDSPKTRAWLACFKKHNDLGDWTPAHPVYIAHSPADDMMPYQVAYNQYLTISNQGQNPNVHMLSVPSMRLVPNGGMNQHFIIAFMGQLIMALVENPEDLQRYFKPVR